MWNIGWYSITRARLPSESCMQSKMAQDDLPISLTQLCNPTAATKWWEIRQDEGTMQDKMEGWRETGQRKIRWGEPRWWEGWRDDGRPDEGKMREDMKPKPFGIGTYHIDEDLLVVPWKWWASSHIVVCRVCRTLVPPRILGRTPCHHSPCWQELLRKDRRPMLAVMPHGVIPQLSPSNFFNRSIEFESKINSDWKMA